MGTKVLAVEDNLLNQHVLKEFLRDAAIDLAVVDNGAAGIEAWAREKFDTILMDIEMPVMDGLTAIQAIRAAETKTGVASPITIIALTASVCAEDVAACRAAGADGFIGKPIEEEELRCALGLPVATAFCSEKSNK